jgi:hypothetical protein
MSDLEKIKSKISAIEQIGRESGLAKASESIFASLQMAENIVALKRLLDGEVMAKFMALQGSPLGFVTDRDKDGGYPIDTVREAIVMALMHGLRPVGNEFNIIGGRFYAAKAGVRRLVLQFPGLTNYEHQVGLAEAKNDDGQTAYVHFIAEFKLHGEPQKFTRKIAVIRNQGMKVDAILGKGERKGMAHLLAKLTGLDIPSTDGEAVETAFESTAPAANPPAKPARIDAAAVSSGIKAAAAEPVAAPSDDAHHTAYMDGRAAAAANAERRPPGTLTDARLRTAWAAGYDDERNGVAP